MKIFRNLNSDEEQEFKDWARNNYKPFSEIPGIWHPIIQAECVQINKENGENVKLPPGFESLLIELNKVENN